LPQTSINTILKENDFFGGRVLPLRRGMVVLPEMGTFLFPAFKNHSPKIASKSVDKYCLLTFTENFKIVLKKYLFIFLLGNKP